MNIVPLSNNALIAGSASSSLNLNTSAQSNASGSKDLASVSQIPSVNVTLSNQANSSAVISASIPPIYSRVSIGAPTGTQLSPSRNSSSPQVAQGSSSASVNGVQIDESGNDSKSVNNSQPDNSESVDVDAASSNQAEPNKSGENKSEANKVISDEAGPSKPASTSAGLSELEIKQVAALQIRDQEVKSHELAHKSVGGQFAGAISLSFQTGPDGRRYAVGGEVPIDVSPVNGDPQATIAKMNTVRAAATAPIDPSAQDQRVAAVASSILSQARSDLVQKNREEAVERDNQQSNQAAQNSNSTVNISGVSQANNDKNIIIDAIV